VLFGAQDDLIAGAHRFMQLVLKTRMEPIEFDRRLRPVLTELGKHLKSLSAYTQIYAPNRCFEPQLKLFLEVFRSHQVSKWFGMSLEESTYRMAAIDFVHDLRSRTRTEGVRRLQADWESKYLKKRRRVMKLERRCFGQCPSVHVVFMHLYLDQWRRRPEELDAHVIAQHKEAFLAAQQFSAEEELVWKLTPQAEVTFEEFQLARQRFFANAKGRTSAFKALLAHAWRTPFAPEAGFHMHGVFFFDAAKVEEAHTLVDRIGGFWRDVTDGSGGFLAGGVANKGVIDRNDWELRDRLKRDLLVPMTRVEHVTAPVPRAANVFGSSWLPPPKIDTDQGSKRKKTISKIVLPERNQQVAPKRSFSSTAVVANHDGRCNGTGDPA
jgi:hypothetical protein